MLKKLAVAVLSITLLLVGGCGSTGPKYLDVHSYSEGLAAAQSSNGKWGFVDENQEWVIEPQFEDVRDFQRGKAAAKMDGKWGFINKHGDWL